MFILFDVFHTVLNLSYNIKLSHHFHQNTKRQHRNLFRTWWNKKGNRLLTSQCRRSKLVYVNRHLNGRNGLFENIFRLKILFIDCCRHRAFRNSKSLKFHLQKRVMLTVPCFMKNFLQLYHFLRATIQLLKTAQWPTK